ncbi:MAG: hypothetical protein ACJ74Q_15410 [Pyrinomonadaceae bacterium]
MNRHFTTLNLTTGAALFLLTFAFGAWLVTPRAVAVRYGVGGGTTVFRTTLDRPRIKDSSSTMSWGTTDRNTLRWETRNQTGMTVGGDMPPAGKLCPAKSATDWCVRIEERHVRTTLRYDAAEAFTGRAHEVPLELEAGGEATVRFYTDDHIKRITSPVNERLVRLVNEETAIEDNKLVLRGGNDFPIPDRVLNPVTTMTVVMTSGRAFAFKIVPTPMHQMVTESDTNCVVSYIQDPPTPEGNARPNSAPSTPCLSKHFSDSCLP